MKRAFLAVGLALLAALAQGLAAPPAAAANILGCEFADAADLVRRTRLTGTRILDIKDRFVAGLGNYYAPLVPYAKLPRHLIDAVVVSEDQRFFEHDGIDWRGVLRAMLENARAGAIRQGGSTLTQQTLKNTCFRDDDDLLRKVKEVLSAAEIEGALGKREVLEVYLNSVPFGGDRVVVHGVQAAARVYFGKYAEELTVLEAAVLAQLLPAPNRYNPHKAPELARERALALIQRMVRAGRLPAAAELVAQRQELRIAPSISGLPGYFASGPQLAWYALWARDEARRTVGPQAGVLTVATTLRPGIQAAAERALGQALRRHGQEHAIGQGAVVVLSHAGDVLAMVGGRDFRTLEWNNATQARRQPGSAFKPFVWAAALERGLAPSSRVLDRPIELGGVTIGNHDGRYRGEVTLGTALAWSSNPAAVRLARGHVPQIVELAHRLGIVSPLGTDAGIALGTSEVTLLELSAAYATIGNGGRRVTPSALRLVRDNDDRIVWCRRPPERPRVLRAEHAEALALMLRQAVRDGTGRQADPGFPAAGKTGTTNDNRDAWFVGFTDRFVVGVWLGNEKPVPMKGVSGGGLPARIWREIVRAAHEEPVIRPAGCPAG